MPKGLYIGDGTSKKVKRVYFGESAVSRKVKKGYIGIDGAAKLFFSGATVWKKYNTVETHTHSWKRYNVNSTTTYTWRKYSITENYTIRLTNDTLSFKWYENDNPYEKVYRSARATGVGASEISLSGLVTITASNYDKLVGYYTTTGSSRYYKITEFTRYEGSSAKYMGTRIEGTKGSSTQTYVGTVTSTDPNAYPNGGTQGGYYYDSRTADTQYSQGSLIDTVTANNSSAYPSNGVSGNYWYVYEGDSVSYGQGTYVEDIEADDPSTYPDNGRHSDGYWYVKQDE